MNEELNKYIKKLKKFEVEILYIFYLIKKITNDKKLVNLSSNYYELFLQNDICEIIDKLLMSNKISKSDKEILEIISENKLAIANEHIRTRYNIGIILESICKHDVWNYLFVLMKKYNENESYLKFTQFANRILNRKEQNEQDLLIFTDSYQLVLCAIGAQMKANIVFKESEVKDNTSRMTTKLMIFAILFSFQKGIKIISGDILTTNLKAQNKYSVVSIYYQKDYKFPATIVQVKKVEENKFEKLSTKTSISNEFFYLNEAYKYLKKDGIIISTISDLALYKIANDEIKSEMVEKKLIKSIETIPSTLDDGSKENNIIILQDECDEITFRYFDKIELLENPDLCNYCKKIQAEDISNFDLRPKKIIFEKDTKDSNIKETENFIIEYYRGCQIRNYKFDKNGTYELLTVSDISDVTIERDLKRFNYEKKTMDRFLRFLLKENDILISTHGTRIKTALVENIGERKIIPNANFIIIRTDYNKVDPYYLEGYLTSKAGTEALTNISTGKSNIIINERNLRDLLTIFFSNMKDIEEQKKIGKKLKAQKEEIERCKAKLKEAIEERESFIEKIYKED